MQRAGRDGECVRFTLREAFGSPGEFVGLEGRARSSPRGPAGFPDPD